MTDRAWPAGEKIQGGAEPEGAAGPAGPGSLLPSFVRAVLAPLGSAATSAYRDERDAMVGAGDRRRAEFFGGRACAHAAVRALGATDAPIAAGPGRQPLWPLGVVGSIAHGGRWCGAVAARAVDARGLGLDIEPVRVLPPAVERLVLTGQERRSMPASDWPAGFAAMVAFSAKECTRASSPRRAGLSTSRT